MRPIMEVTGECVRNLAKQRIECGLKDHFSTVLPLRLNRLHIVILLRSDHMAVFKSPKKNAYQLKFRIGCPYRPRKKRVATLKGDTG